MPAIDLGYQTLPDLIRTRSLANGKLKPFIDPLEKRTPFFKTIPAERANSFNDHKWNLVTERPKGKYHKIGDSTLPSKAKFIESSMSTAMYNTLLRCPADLYPDVENDEASRLALGEFFVQQTDLGVEQLNVEMETGIVYATKNIQGYDGLATVLNTINPATNKAIARQVFSAVDSPSGTQNTSIYIINHQSYNAISWVYPSMQGMTMEQEGSLQNYGISVSSDWDKKVTETKSDGSVLCHYDRWIRIKGGLAIKNITNIVRIANIPKASLDNGSLELAGHISKAIKMVAPSGDVSRIKIYCNLDVHTGYVNRMLGRSNGAISPGQEAFLSFEKFGPTISVEIAPSILSNESAVF